MARPDPLRQAIRLHVLEVLQGASGPTRQVALGRSVKHVVVPDWSLDTCRRRVKEAVSRLVRDGHPIRSDCRGYQLDVSPGGRAAGRRFILAQLGALGMRLRAFDRAAGDKVSQLHLDLVGSPAKGSLEGVR